MPKTSPPARISAVLAAAVAAAAIVAAAPTATAAPSSTPPDCLTLTHAENALTAAQKAAAAAQRKDHDAQSKLTTDQARGAAKTVIDADEAALGTAQDKMLLADNAVYTAQGNVEEAKEAIQRDGITCTPTPGGGGGGKGQGQGPGGGDGKGQGPGGGTVGPVGGGSSGNGGSNPINANTGDANQSVTVTGGNASNTAQNTVQNTTVVDPSVVLDPTAADGSQATTSGTEVTDVPTGSASTGAA